MKEIKRNSFSLKHLSICILFVATVVSCKKEYKTNVPSGSDAIAEFAPASGIFTANYFVNAANDPLLIPVGFNGFSDADRTITFTVTSKRAVVGAQYEAPAPVTIKAGKVLDTLRFKGLSAGYPNGRKDTVVIKINGYPTVNKIDSFTVILQPFCSETIVTAASVQALAGSYAHTNELYGTSAYGPYVTAISNVVIGSNGTSATITVGNIWDSGWGPINFILDWSNPANKTVTAVSQAAIPGSNAGDLSTTYAGMPIAERQFTGNLGTFTICNQSLILRLQLGVSSGGTVLGYFASLYQVTLTR